MERIINLIAFGKWVENRVLIGPYQPLYGAGIVLAILVYDLVIVKYVGNKNARMLLLFITAIITTSISEAVTGFGFEFLYNHSLWDYNLFFTCNLKYVCVVPTSLFGLLSFLTIIIFHPFVVRTELMISKKTSIILFILFVIDIVYTFAFRL